MHPYHQGLRDRARHRGHALNNLKVEALEERQLLAADPAFAFDTGRLTAARPVEIFEFHIDPTEFTLVNGQQVLLRIDVVATGNAALDPAALVVQAKAGTGTPAPVIRALGQQNAGLNKSSSAVVQVQPGDFTVRVSADRGTLGTYQVRYSLSGDVTGDRLVDNADIAALNAAVRKPPRVPGALDVNLDGRVSALDVTLAQNNLGAATRVLPIQPLILQLDPVSDPDGDGIVTERNVVLAGLTNPNMQVSYKINGVAQTPVISDAQGRFSIRLAVNNGVTTVIADVSDLFGQSSEAEVQITRRGDLQPPVIAITSPASGLFTNKNIDIQGRVTDNYDTTRLTLTVSIDGATAVPVALDAQQRFVFRTGFPLDGSSDGLHGLNFVARDAAGNVSNAVEFTMNLDTLGPGATLLEPDKTYPAQPNLQVLFSESVAANAIDARNYSLVVLDGPNVGQTFDVAQARLLADKLIEITLANPLLETRYALRIGTGVTDLAGNSVRPPRELAFNVDPIAPTVVDVGLSNANAATSPYIDVSFSEVMGADTFLTGNFVLTFENGFRAGQVVPITSVERRSNGGVARVFLQTPLADARYRLTMGARATDVAGNRVSQPNPFPFTAELSPPSAKVNVTGVIAGTVPSITVTYSEAMSPSAFLSAAYRLTIVGGPNDGQIVPLVGIARVNELSVVLSPEVALNNNSFRLELDPNLTDLAGKALVSPTSFLFTVDTLRPVATLSIVGTLTQSVNTFDVLFSEPMNDQAFSINNYQLIILNGSGAGLPVAIASVTKINAQTARIVLSTPLPSATFRLNLSQAIRDLAGNVVVSDGFLDFTVDVTAPTATLNFVGTDTPLGGIVRQSLTTWDVTYSEPMGPAAFSPGQYGLQVLGNNANIAGLQVVKISDTVARIVLAAPLADATYLFKIGANVADANGILLGGSHEFTFAVSSQSPTAIVTFSSQLDPINAPMNGFLVTYNRAMASSAFVKANYSLRNAQGVEIPFQDVVRLSATEARLQVAQALPVGQYQFVISNAVTDAAGGVLVQPLTFPITVQRGPGNPAPLAALNVEGTIVNVPIDALELFFSESMPANAFNPVNYQLVRLGNNLPGSNEFIGIESIAQISPSQARLFLSVPLPSGNYQLIASPAVTDFPGSDGIARPLIVRDFFFGVTLPVTDVTPPQVDRLIPASPVIANSVTFFDIRYTEAMTQAAFQTNSYSVLVQTGPGQFQPVALSSVTAVDERTVRITPSLPLASATYQVVIDPVTPNGNVLRNPSRLFDLAGNSLTGGRILPLVVSPASVDAVPPTATISVPALQTTPLAFIDVAFSESMSASAFVAGNYALTTIGGVAVPIASVTQIDETTARVTPAGFLPDNRYQLTLSPVITDKSNNPVTPPRAFVFELNTVRPTVALVQVAGVIVPLGANPTITNTVNSIDITFSETMATNAFLANAYQLQTTTGAAVALNSVVKLSDNSARLILSAPLANAAYQLTVNAQATDLAGNPVTPALFTFQVNVAPVTVVTPQVNVSVSASNRILLSYTKPMAASTFAVGSYQLVAENGTVIPIALVSRVNESSARLVLLSPLAAGRYRLAIKPQVTDLDGNALGTLIYDITV